MRCGAIGSWLVFVVALAAESTGMALGPRARLRVVARGAVAFKDIQLQIMEVTAALARLTAERTCTEENGCLVVDIRWQPAAKEECATSMQMSLLMLPNATDTAGEQVNHDESLGKEGSVKRTILTGRAKNAVDRILDLGPKPDWNASDDGEGAGVHK